MLRHDFLAAFFASRFLRQAVSAWLRFLMLLRFSARCLRELRLSFLLMSFHTDFHATPASISSAAAADFRRVFTPRRATLSAAAVFAETPLIRHFIFAAAFCRMFLLLQPLQLSPDTVIYLFSERRFSSPPMTFSRLHEACCTPASSAREGQEAFTPKLQRLLSFQPAFSRHSRAEPPLSH